MNWRLTILSLAAIATPLMLAAPTPADSVGSVPPDHAQQMTRGTKVFTDSVRTIFLEQCIKCHGGDRTKSGFDMASREGLLKGGDNGVCVVPGDSRASKIMKLLRHEEEPYMPSKKPRMSDEQIALIAQWIDAGAPYDKPLAEKGGPKKAMQVMPEDRLFWSFVPLKRPEVPKIAGAKTPIDAFVLAKLGEHKLTPTAPAEKITLIRRAYFDLIGLPPTPEQVDAFVADSAPDAYEKLIDRLLEDPRYGERWAPHWLDVARFAESDGFEHDYARANAYHYRDFVIRALNDDLPYNQFVQWQIAGDEIAPQEPMAMMATGFLAAGVFPTQITEKEFESTRYDQLDDMIATIGPAFLGLTVGCARCHDHKYDPIPTLDYYRLAANFTKAIPSEVKLDVGTAAEREKSRKDLDPKRAAAVAALANYERDVLPHKFQQYVASFKQGGSAVAPTWSVVKFADCKSDGGAKLVLMPDGSLLNQGGSPSQDGYTLNTRVDSTGITAIRIEALTHDSFPNHGPGMAGNGNFVLSDLKVTAAPANGSSPAVSVKLISARATHQQNKGELSVAASIDDKPTSGWAVDGGGIGHDQAAIFEFDKPIGFPGGTTLTFKLRFDHPNGHHIMGRPRISITTAAPPVQFKAADGPEPAILATLTTLANGGNVETAQGQAALSYFSSTLTEYQKLKSEAEAIAAAPSKTTETVMVTTEGLKPRTNHADGRGYPHFYPETFLLDRGDVNKKVRPVTGSFLQVLMRDGADEKTWQQTPPPGSKTTYQRKALAEWITDNKRGAGDLAARVAVNRLWQHHMGKGIVATPNDFGFQGDRPTHPELLDWLASELISNGWHLKPIHKLIMTSATYMQSAVANPADAAIDPQNRWFWRYSPRRLEGESIRDSMLFVSGLLDNTMYGPGTLNEGSTRRSVYFTVKRANLVPSMQLFDWPERLGTIGARPQTTISPQALMFMNSPQVRKYAEALAKRLAPEYQKSTADAVRMANRLAFGHVPSDAAVERGVAFIERQKKLYHDGNPKDDGKLESLVDFCQAMMSLNEFVYVD